jgi:hypothetical protein
MYRKGCTEKSVQQFLGPSDLCLLCMNYSSRTPRCKVASTYNFPAFRITELH